MPKIFFLIATLKINKINHKNLRINTVMSKITNAEISKSSTVYFVVNSFQIEQATVSLYLHSKYIQNIVQNLQLQYLL